MAGKLASLIIKIAADGASAEKELKKLERKMSDWSKTLKRIGTDMSKYITAPITAMAGVSVAAANTQLQAEAKLLTALQGRSDVQQRLIAQAAELQSRSTLGDEAIIEQQAYLAALGLSEQQIGATIEAAAQLSAALNMDLGSAVKNLAKTYGGMTGELGEGIPALKNLTKEQLQAGEAIKYVNDNYKGFAETAAQTGTGPLTQLKNIIGDIAESFGVILLPAIQKFAAKLKELALAFQQLSPKIKETIVTVAAIAAAIGPALVVFSKMLTAVKLVSLALPALGASLTAAAAGPIAAITAGVLALASAWLLAKDRASAYKALEEGRKQGASDRQQEAYERAMKQYGSAGKAEIEKQIAEWTEMRDREAAYYISASGGRMTEQQTAALVVYDGTLNALKEILETRKEEERVAKSINGETTAQVGIIAQLNAKISELEKSKTAANSEAEIKRINGELAQTRSELERLVDLGNKSIVPKIEKPEGFEGLSLADSTNLLELTPPEIKNTTLAPNQMSAYWQDFADKAKRSAELIESVTQVIGSALANLATTIGEGLGNLMSGLDVDPGKALLELLGNSLKSLGAALVTYATTMQAFKDALKDVFLDPWSAILLGTGAIALGQLFVNMAKEPIKLASGGLAYGPTLAVVGDNRGAASDPEVIAPLSKLRNYMGGQQLELVGGVAFELRGDVARAILDRENMRLNRKG